MKLNVDELKPIFCGIQKFTMLDYGGSISAIFFTGGCNFRCSYCHNPEFVLPNDIRYEPVLEFISFLKKRVGLLKSIVICGGEPTLHGGNLINWIRYIKNLGFNVKLDTNGTRPDVIKKLIDENLVDFFAVDFKTSFAKYDLITKRNINILDIKESIRLILESNINYEFRSTIHSSLHSIKDVNNMIFEMKALGIKSYYLQGFKMPKKTVGDIENENVNLDLESLFLEKLKLNFENSGIRNI